nr:hypothetical protein [Treponema sp.]
MIEGLSIADYEYNDKEKIFIIRKNDENLYMYMGLCGFDEEMAYWGMPTKKGKFNDELGFVFSKEINTDDIRMEIERFISHNEI